MANNPLQPVAQKSAPLLALLAICGLAVVLVAGYFLASSLSAEDAPPGDVQAGSEQAAAKAGSEAESGSGGGTWSVGPKGDEPAKAAPDLAGVTLDNLRGPCHLKSECVSLGTSCPVAVLGSKRSLADAYMESADGKAACETAAKRYSGKKLEFQAACRKDKCVSVARRPGAPRVSKPTALRPSRQEIGLMKKNLSDARHRAKQHKARAGKGDPAHKPGPQAP